MRRKLKAFTLAELLLAMGIVGTIAVMTLPTLRSEVEDKKVVAVLKTTYNNLENAYHNCVTKQEKPITAFAFPGTSSGDYQSNTPYFANLLFSELKLKKQCGFDNADASDCFTNTVVNGLNRAPVTAIAPKSYFTAVLENDVAISIVLLKTSCDDVSGNLFNNICGNIYVDVDGPDKGTFTYGKDVFIFRITADGLIPAGTRFDRQYAFNKVFHLDGGQGDRNNDNCLYGAGLGCTAWVIYNKNRDYLKCKNIDWNTKSKCD